MGSYVLKDGQGSFSKNPTKTSDNHPDIKGKISIGGRLYWLSAWKRHGDNGIWYALQATPADASAQVDKQAPKVSPTDGVDDIGF